MYLIMVDELQMLDDQDTMVCEHNKLMAEVKREFKVQIISQIKTLNHD